jgi:flavorubredoxin
VTRHDKPLYPEHGEEYHTQMAEAKQLYDEWVASRQKRSGVKLFAVRSNSLEEITHADI